MATKKVTVKKKMGRPSPFDSLDIEMVKRIYKQGLTDKQVAEVIGVTEQTITNWKKAYPDFFASLKEAKAFADKEVEASLYKRACGYMSQAEVTKEFMTDEDGNLIQVTKVVEKQKSVAPDPTSMIFWLKNRQPEKWREKQEVELSGDLNVNLKKRVIK